MVRPAHDIPNMLLGAIRDYAEREDITDEEAHICILRTGLLEVGMRLECGGKPKGDDSANTEQKTDGGS